MTTKTPSPCPCCASEQIGHAVGDRSIWMNDLVQCLSCGLTMEGDYEPNSALVKWEVRPEKSHAK
jgi:uncharacterized Zn finger protein